LSLDAKEEGLGETLLQTKMKHPRFCLLSKQISLDCDDSEELPAMNLGHEEVVAATDTTDVLCINSCVLCEDGVNMCIVSEGPAINSDNGTYEVKTEVKT